MYEKTTSPLPEVDHYWHMITDEVGSYPNPITALWGLVFIEDAKHLTVRLVGPQTKPTILDYSAGQEYWGIVLKEHTSLANMHKVNMVDSMQALPLSPNGSEFILAGNQLSIPRYNELDEFAHDCVARKIFIQDEKAAALIGGRAMSVRTKQRLYRSVTGVTSEEITQAARVYAAIELLGSTAMPIAEIAQQAGFTDQAHMTRTIKRFVGFTPAKIRGYYQHGAIVQ